jgi:hypothetical protein
VQVRTADSRVSDLNIDVRLLKGLAVLGELLPDHLSVCGLRAQAHPSFELVVFARHCWRFLVGLRKSKGVDVDVDFGQSNR